VGVEVVIARRGKILVVGEGVFQIQTQVLGDAAGERRRGAVFLGVGASGRPLTTGSGRRRRDNKNSRRSRSVLSSSTKPALKLSVQSIGSAN